MPQYSLGSRYVLVPSDTVIAAVSAFDSLVTLPRLKQHLGWFSGTGEPETDDFGDNILRDDLEAFVEMVSQRVGPVVLEQIVDSYDYVAEVMQVSSVGTIAKAPSPPLTSPVLEYIPEDQNTYTSITGFSYDETVSPARLLITDPPKVSAEHRLPVRFSYSVGPTINKGVAKINAAIRDCMRFRYDNKDNPMADLTAGYRKIMNFWLGAPIQV